MTQHYFIYIMTNKSRTLYTGITNNLERRVYEHKNKLVPGFTARYNISTLVYFEETPDVLSAIAREKQIKGWLRSKKISLIEAVNPQWFDLSAEWFV
jgi:putative endonuclease